jgi:hypothetical protein
MSVSGRSSDRALANQSLGRPWVQMEPVSVLCCQMFCVCVRANNPGSHDTVQLSLWYNCTVRRTSYSTTILVPHALL